MIAYRQIGDSFIPAQHQPALVLDYARSRDIDEQGDKLLRGTGLQGWDMPAAGTTLSPAEYLQLLIDIGQQKRARVLWRELLAWQQSDGRFVVVGNPQAVNREIFLRN